MNKQLKDLMEKNIRLIAVGGIIIAIMGGLAASNLKPHTVNTQPAANTQPKSTPTVSLTSLNSQAVPILTMATNSTEQLMTTGQADAAQSNALTMNPLSAFEQWRKVVEQQTDTDITNAWGKVTSLYYDGNQDLPIADNNWNTDITATYSDIGVWQLSEVGILVDKDSGVSSTSDQAITDKAYQAYQSDLAKAKADISQL